MSFNKHFPDRVATPERAVSAVDRARIIRLAFWVSTFMLVVGYALLFWHLDLD